MHLTGRRIIGGFHLQVTIVNVFIDLFRKGKLYSSLFGHDYEEMCTK